MAVRLSVLRVGRALHPPPGRFLVLISVRGTVKSRDIVRLEGLDKLENFNDIIGNRTRDLPACSIVPQPVHILSTLNMSHIITKFRIADVLGAVK
jgi:hypothetical protein